jgi:hypothetical protein
MNSVFERELRAQSRNRQTWRLRMAVGFGVAAWMAFLFWWTPEVFVRNGEQAFLQLNLMGALILGVVAPGLSHDLISREAREGTLGLLLSTPLTPGDVLMGKLGAVLVRALTVWLAMAPILMLPVLQGGVRGVEMRGMGMMQGMVTLVGLSSGLVSSCWNRRAGWSLFVAYGFTGVMALTVLIPVGVVLVVSGGAAGGVLGATALMTVLGLGFAYGLHVLAAQELKQIWSRLRAVGEVRDELLELGVLAPVGAGWSQEPVAVATDSMAIPEDGTRPPVTPVAAPGSRNSGWGSWVRSLTLRHRAQLLERDPWRWLMERRSEWNWRLFLNAVLIGFLALLGLAGLKGSSWPLWVVQGFLCLVLPRLLLEERQNGMFEVLRTTPMIDGLVGAVQRLTWIRYGPVVAAYGGLTLWWRAQAGQSGMDWDILPLLCGMWTAPYLVTAAVLWGRSYWWGVGVMLAGAFKLGSVTAHATLWVASRIIEVSYTFMDKQHGPWAVPLIQVVVTLLVGFGARRLCRELVRPR